MDGEAGWPGRVAYGARAFHEGLSWRNAGQMEVCGAGN